MGFGKPGLQTLLSSLGPAVRDGDAELEALQPTDEAAAGTLVATLHAEADVFPSLRPLHPCCVFLDWHNGFVGRERWGHSFAKGRLASIGLRSLRFPKGLPPTTAGRAESG